MTQRGPESQPTDSHIHSEGKKRTLEECILTLELERATTVTDQVQTVPLELYSATVLWG